MDDSATSSPSQTSRTSQTRFVSPQPSSVGRASDRPDSRHRTRRCPRSSQHLHALPSSCTGPWRLAGTIPKLVNVSEITLAHRAPTRLPSPSSSRRTPVSCCRKDAAHQQPWRPHCTPCSPSSQHVYSHVLPWLRWSAPLTMTPPSKQAPSTSSTAASSPLAWPSSPLY
jgi:hypothetical protein